MSIALAAWQAGWRPRDVLSRGAWAEKHVRPPGSARSTAIDLSLSPWLREPIDFSADNNVREQVLLMPTGAGKTTIFDCIIPHTIAEDPGGILLSLQTDKDAREYVEERLLPILRDAEPVAAIMAGMDRHAIRKDAVIFPHMPLYMGGANITNAQRKSVRLVLLDEFWTYKHGLGAEFRARTHDRWNSRVVIVSQGGWVSILRDTGHVETELESAWKRTDRREWCFECPQCRLIQRFRMKCLRYERAEDSRGILEENVIAESARYLCAGAIAEEKTCDAVFEDKTNIRRALANSGRYVVQNSTHLARHHGWHCNALTLHYVRWGTLAVEHANAMRDLTQGDDSAARIYRQKRLAENEVTEQKVMETALTIGTIGDPPREYTFADYMSGETWPGEAIRIMTVDVQRDHFWAVIRAWKVDGTSRRLWCGKINTMGAVQEKQAAYKVKPAAVYIDSKYDTDTVYNACAANGWAALQGEGQKSSFAFPAQQGRRKFYSPIQWVVPTCGKRAMLVFWAVTPIKRILEKMRGGYRSPWECEGDMDPEHRAQLFSEIEKDVMHKVTKAITRLFVKLRRDNHLFDCEGMQVVGALIARMLADQPGTAPDKPEAAAEPETPA